MVTRRASLLAFVVLATTISSAYVMAGLGHHCKVTCPDCGCAVCEPTPTVLKEKKTAYSCECKEICIPGVTGPFADCCDPPRCGKVRTVKVLKKTEYECSKCGYKWNVKHVSCEYCK